MSAIFLSLPIRYPLWRWIYNTGKVLSPLNGYRRHLLLGLRASSGSLYLITTPRNVLVSSASFPVVSKFGFSFSLTGLGGDLSFLSPHSYFVSSFLNRRRSRSSRSVLENLKVIIHCQKLENEYLDDFQKLNRLKRSYHHSCNENQNLLNDSYNYFTIYEELNQVQKEGYVWIESHSK